jgi:hypothetical protein
MEHRVQRPNNSVIVGGRWALVLAAAAAIGLGTPPAIAAVERLPDGLNTTASLSSDQKSQVQRFVAEQFERIRTGDAVAIEEGRRSLMSAFEGAEPSIGFRLEFGRAGAADIRRLATGPDLHRAINAILVAGSCGSSETIDAITPALADRRPAIRSACATALREVIATSTETRVRRDQGAQAVRTIGAALAKESDPVVALALVAALEPARSTQFHADASMAIGAAIGPLTKALPGPTTDAAIRGVEAVQRGVSLMFTRLIDPAQAAGVNRDYLVAVVGAGNHALAFAARHAQQTIDDGNPDAASALGLLVASAEQGILFGEARLADRAPESSALKAAFDAGVSSGDATDFTRLATETIARSAKAIGASPADFSPADVSE